MHWLETLMEKYGRLRLANEAIMADDLQSVLRDGRAQVRAAFAQKPSETKEADDMLVVGDNYQVTQAQPQHRGDWLKLVIGLGLLGAGVGTGVGGWLVADAIRSQKPAETTVIQSEQQDPTEPLRFKLELGDPE